MLFKQGNAGGPGRPKGSRNKLGEAFIQTLYADFIEHGAGAIEAVRTDDPATYMRVVAALLPRELEVKRPLADLSDDELANALEFIRAAIASDSGDAPDGAEAAAMPQKPPGALH